MMKVTSLMLYAISVEATARFYRALGVDFEAHPGGPSVGDADGCRIAIVAATSGDAAGPGVGGTTMPGFEVESIEDAVERLREMGRKILREPESLSWGRRAVVSDPDGRAVELIERP